MLKFTLPLRLSAAVLLLSALGAHAQTVTTFEGIDASQVAKPNLDVDPNGAVGTKQYMEWTNVYYQAWDKTTHTPVWTKPLAGTTPWVTNGNANCTSISGDGVIIFDRLASRWVIAAHNSGSTNYYYCVAISNTDDLTSPSLAWYTYAIPLNNILGTNAQGTTYFPDWPKIATWPDAYYVAMDMEDTNNKFAEVGVLVCALDRASMLIGGTPNTPQCFQYPENIGGSIFLGHSLQPADVEGTTPPPTGAPEYYVSIENPVIDGVTTTSDSLNMFQFHVDWSNPADSTFAQSSVPVTAFKPGCYAPKNPANTICVPEPSTAATANYIDSVGDRLMPRFAYRNFGSYESYLVSHAVQVGSANLSQTGIRWYEFRGSGIPALNQSGTISPDNSLYRFMPSIAQDQSANAAVGYSTSSASAHPGMSASWWNLNAQSSPTEVTLFNGSADQENTYHWGDYTSMTVDPVGGCAFWYVNEFFNTNQIGTGKPVWQTRIGTFTAPGCGSVSLTPTSLAFGSQGVGTTSASQQLILSNGMSTALAVSSIRVAGTDPNDFKQTNDCGSSVSAGDSCTITVSFTPTAAGARSAQVSVTDNAPNSPQTATLTGTGTSGGMLTVAPATVSFGNETTGSTSAPTPVTVTNTGNAKVTFTSIAITGTNATSFGESDNCLPSLAAGKSCTMNVTFAPATTGAFSAAVTLTDDANNNPQSVGLTGTGTLPVTLSASNIAFGLVEVGNSKTAAPVTLTNQMSVALTGITVAASGTGYTELNTCGNSIAAGATCTITVTFKPTTGGQSKGTITITDSANTSPQTITLTGTGQMPVVISPASLAFGTVKVGTMSGVDTVTLTNNLKTSLSITNIGFGGTNASDFSMWATTCASVIGPGANCTISVVFTPKATGARTGNLLITDSAPTSPQTVKLTGTGK